MWVLGVIFALVAVLDLWLMILAGRGSIYDARFENAQQFAHSFYRGAVGNAAIAVLCFVGWLLMRRHTRRALWAGALTVAMALFLSSVRWIRWEIAEMATAEPVDLVEPLLIWPLMAYAVMYGYREGNRKSDCFREASKPTN